MKPIRFNPHLRLTGCDAWLNAKVRLLLYCKRRQRRLSRSQYENFAHCVEVLIANLVQLNCVAADWPLMVRRGRNASSEGRCFGTHHVDVLEALAKKYYTSMPKTVKWIEEGQHRTLTSIEIREFPFGDITLANVAQAPRERCVQLKTTNEYGYKQEIPLPEGQSALVEQMQRINSYLKSVPVQYSPHGYPATHWVEMSDKWPTAMICNISDPSMCRIFSEDTHHGGRLFWGWWLNLNKQVRFDTIKLKGEAIAYVDFNSLNLRLAYATVGQPFPGEASYEAAGFGTRSGWKQLTLAMLMAKSRLTHYVGTNAEQAKLREAMGDKASICYAAIEEKHPALAGIWYTGIGTRFQCIESDIMAAVLERCQANGLAVLPVHDCCICPVSEATRVARIMEAEAVAVGYLLPTGIETQP